MKEWLKFIGLSFFSDKIAAQAPRRGLGNVFLVIVLGAVFMLLGLIGAYTLTFSANYSNAPELVATVECALSADGAAPEIKDGTLFSDKLIDTVGSEEDKRNYSRGYDIVVDTRKADTFDDFTAYCVSSSGKEITYEQYLELDDDAKSLYEFKIRYSGKSLVIGDELIDKCEKYLDGVTDDGVRESYGKVKEKTGEEYAAALYDLYVRTYYPSLTAYESDGGAPKARNYYYHNYRTNDKIIFVFSNAMMGTFVTKTGARHTFYGYYGKLSDGAIGSSARSASDFVIDSFKGATSMTVYSGVVAFFSVAPFIVLVAFAVIIALFCFTKLLKLDELRFGAAAKTVCAFVWVSALITALVTFALGFLVSQSLLAWLEGVVFFGVLMIRTAIMLISAAIRRKRESVGDEIEPVGDETEPEKITGDIDDDTVRG